MVQIKCLLHLRCYHHHFRHYPSHSFHLLMTFQPGNVISHVKIFWMCVPRKFSHPCQLCLWAKWRIFHQLLSHSDFFFARIEKFNIYEKFSASVGTQNMLRQNRKVMMMMPYVMEIFVERKFENQVFLRQVRTCMNLVL